MKTIFVSYRRADSLEAAKALKKRLNGWFGSELVFRDEDSIPYGFDFRDVIRDSLSESVAVLVIIGPGWVDARDDSGRRRLEAEDDPVRVEVKLALESKVAVIPVILPGAELPTPESLPSDIRAFRFRNAAPFDPAADDERLKQLRDDLLSCLVSPGPNPRSLGGRYLPEGVWFRERATGWELVAKIEKQRVSVARWALIIAAGIPFVLVESIAVGIALVRDEVAVRGGPSEYALVSKYQIMASILIGIAGFSFLLIPALRRAYAGLMSNVIGSTLISRRGDTIQVRDGTPILDRTISVKLGSIDSIEVRPDGFGLVVKRGGLIDLVECYDFGSRLTTKKRLFFAKTLGKLLNLASAGPTVGGRG